MSTAPMPSPRLSGECMYAHMDGAARSSTARSSPSSGRGVGGSATAAAATRGVTAGEFIIDPPTLINLGFEWLIDGDDNRNASVEVSYRKQGESAWKRDSRAAITSATAAPGMPHGLRYGRSTFGYFLRRIMNETSWRP